MCHRARAPLLLVCLASLAAACGGSTKDPDSQGTAEAPPFGGPLSTHCPENESDWLDVEAKLPGRWSYGSRFMEVGAELNASWGRRVESSDLVEGTSAWSRDAEGLVEEMGAGPCSDGSECGARFVRRGTLAVDEDRLAFYALWPLERCHAAVAGRYEGRERFETNRSTGGELRLWSQRAERLTLETDGTWLWSLEAKTYASVNDLGTVYWLAEPSTRSDEDRGTYRRNGDTITFTRPKPASNSSWLSAAAGESVELEPIGRALPVGGVADYERVLP